MIHIGTWAVIGACAALIWYGEANRAAFLLCGWLLGYGLTRLSR